MRRLLLISGLVLAASGSAQAGSNGECSCRYKGGEIFEGQTACIKTANGPTMARCERFLNNTSWKFLNQPCPTASLAPEMTPADPQMRAFLATSS